MNSPRCQAARLEGGPGGHSSARGTARLCGAEEERNRGQRQPAGAGTRGEWSHSQPPRLLRIAKATPSRFRLSPKPGPLPCMDVNFKTFPVEASTHCWGRTPSQGMGGREAEGGSLHLCHGASQRWGQPACWAEGVQLCHVGAGPAGAPRGGETPHCTPAFAVVLISQERVRSRFQLWSSVRALGTQS